MPATSLMITRREMNNARDAGRARPLSPAITEFTKYSGDWWVSSADGWLRITDTHLASRLDLVRDRLDAADEDAACLRSQEQASDTEDWSWLPAESAHRPCGPHHAAISRRARQRAVPIA